MTVHLTSAQEEQLASMAAASNRTADELAQEAVDRFLEARAEHSIAVAKAREQILLGQTISQEEVFAQLKQRMGW